MPKYTPPQVWQSDFSTHPLFAGYESVCREIEGSVWPNLSALNNLARKNGVLNAKRVPIQFAEHETPKGQRAYETQIHQTGFVPTRTENWHDLLNACVWLTWPKLKAALNHIHCLQVQVGHINGEFELNRESELIRELELIRKSDLTSDSELNCVSRLNDQSELTAQSQLSTEPKLNGQYQRSRESDTATLFDESGAILIGPDPRLAQWLIDHDWHRAFVTERHLWQSHRLLVIGHAVLEKTINPYPGMIAKVLYQPYPTCTPDQDLSVVVKAVDDLHAQRWLNQTFAKPSDLFALPILGVPGVDALNENTQYYENEKVFRPLRA